MLAAMQRLARRGYLQVTAAQMLTELANDDPQMARELVSQCAENDGLHEVFELTPEALAEATQN